MKKFIEELEKKGYSYKVERDRVTISKENHNVNLDSLTTLPEGTVFENGGYVNLDSLTTIPEKTVFNNGVSLYLNSVTTLSKGVVFKNGGHISLTSVTTLTEEVLFDNEWDVNLKSLTTVHKEVMFKNIGFIYLDSLTNVSDKMIFRNEGRVYLPKMPSEPIIYKGKKFSVRTVDGSTMLISSSKKVGEYIVHRALYFEGGDLENLSKAYLAEKDGVYIHGETIDQAIRDVAFKYRQKNLDVSDLAKEVKAKGYLTKEDYRLLTGACKLGVNKFIEDNEIATDRLSIEEVLELTKDAYGGETIRELFGE